MILAEFITAALFTLLFVGLFGLAFKRRGPWPGLGWFFLIVLLGAWAIGTWTAPVGPVLYGVSWVPFFFGALIIGLLVASLSEPAPRVSTEPATAPEAVAVGVFFWMLVLVLFGVILASLFMAA